MVTVNADYKDICFIVLVVGGSVCWLKLFFFPPENLSYSCAEEIHKFSHSWGFVRCVSLLSQVSGNEGVGRVEIWGKIVYFSERN